MKDWIKSLAGSERLDLAALLVRSGDEYPFLARLQQFPWGDGSLLELAQAAADALLEAPAPASTPVPESTADPWWRPMPAAYVAALFQHVGLPEVSSPEAGRAEIMPPHARESAWIAREFLRGQGVPFEVREHAAALILGCDKPAGLLGSGAPAESYMRLACALDLRALYHLRRADLRAVGCSDDDSAAKRLEAFREQAEQLGVFGGPVAPPLGRDRAREAGFACPREQHRVLNALRYFHLVARISEQDWHLERLRLEKERLRGRLHLLVGPAGCGKSSWAQEHLAETTIISSDQMREELTGDPADQSQNYLVFQRCMDRVRERLREGKEVTFDATNYSEDLRSMPVQAARWSAAEISSYLFDVPLDEALDRNRQRDRSVPESVVRRQHRLLEPPALYEADRHAVVDSDGGSRVYWPIPRPQEGQGP
ncbi:MAG: AAA family ATPase [Planctomycetota bacterium]|jgi:protein phosphatase